MITRRFLLKTFFGTAAASAGGLSALAASADPLLEKALNKSEAKVVYDARFTEAREMAEQAKEVGFSSVDPKGETVRLFYGEKKHWLSSDTPIVGVTGYADFILMSDLARENGRKMAYAFVSEQKNNKEISINQCLEIQQIGDLELMLRTSCGNNKSGVIGWVIT